MDKCNFKNKQTDSTGQMAYYGFYFNTGRLVLLDTVREYQRWLTYKHSHVFSFKFNRVILFDVPSGQVSRIKKTIRISLSNFRTLKAEALNIRLSNNFHDFISGITTIISGVSQVGSAANKMNHVGERIDEAFDSLASVIANKPTINFFLPKLLKTLLDLLSLFKHGDILSIANTLLSFFNLFSDYKLVFPESLDALFLSACSMLLPSQLYEIFKRLSLFTNSKLLDDMHVLDSVISIVHEFLKQTLLFFNLFTYTSFVDTLFSYIPFGKKMILTKQMRCFVSRAITDPKSLSDVNFRLQVKTFNSNIKIDLDFLEWCKRSQTMSNLKNDFDRLCKNVQGYERATRTEPNCFVFEGPPGCKKSMFAGKLSELLTRKDAMTVYSHLVKAVTDGKDWYDSYNNEDIFLMDDVGQQGISQWRTLINMVSPLRLPLDCADAKLKDTKFFSSENILITTNRFSNLNGFSKNDCIADPHALWRRGFVFDFDEVKMDTQTGKLTGLIYFKYYNITANIWEISFPAYVKTSLPISCDSSNELQTLAWMRRIVLMFKAYKVQFTTDSTLTDSQIDMIDQYDENYGGIVNEDRAAFFDAESDSMFSFVSDYEQLILECFSDFKKYLLSLIPDFLRERQFVPLIVSTMLFGIGFYYVNNLFNKTTQHTPEAKYEKLKKFFTTDQLSTTDVSFISKNIKDVNIKSSKGIHECTAILSGHYAIVPAHVAFEEHCMMQIIQDSLRNLVLIDYIPVNRVFMDMKSDVAIYEMPPKNLTPFKSLAHFFTTRKTNQEIFLITPMGIIPLLNHIKRDDLSDVYYTNAPEGYKAFVNYISKDSRMDYYISCPTLCGSPVFDGCIRGFHVAGDGISGSSIIWSDRITTTLHDILSSDKYILPMEIKNVKDSTNLSATQVEFRFGESTPKDSNYAPTKIFGVFPVEREPANMMYDGPHTIKTLMKKNMSINKPLDLPLYEEASRGFDCFFQNYTKSTDEEIIAGFDAIARMNPTTSNGMFYDKEKSQYIDYELKSFKPDFKHHLDTLENDILQGKIPPELVFVKSTLKDEVRDKAKQGKPRAFQVMPLSLQVLTKKYFARFVQNIVKTRDFHKVSIGINPYTEWNDFYTQIKNHKSFDMDFPDWDGNMLAAAQDIICRKMMQYFQGSKEDAIIAEVVLRTIIVKVIVCNDDGFLVSHGLPSGSFLTAIVNSLVNLLNGMAWYISKSGKNVDTFFQSVSYYTYGDDNVTVIKDPSLYDCLNAITYKDFLREIGINCTTANKQEVTERFSPLHEIAFLKRKFVFSHDLGKMMGALDPKSLLTGLNWYDSSSNDDPDKILQDKIACFQREAFLHGQDFYTTKVSELSQYCKDNDVACDVLPYRYLLNLYTRDKTEFSSILMKKYDVNLLI